MSFIAQMRSCTGRFETLPTLSTMDGGISIFCWEKYWQRSANLALSCAKSFCSAGNEFSRSSYSLRSSMGPKFAARLELVKLQHGSWLRPVLFFVFATSLCELLLDFWVPSYTPFRLRFLCCSSWSRRSDSFSCRRNSLASSWDRPSCCSSELTFMIRSTSGLKSPIWLAGGGVEVAALAERLGVDVVLPFFGDATWLADMLEVLLVAVSSAGRSCASLGGDCERSADSLSVVNASIKPRFLLVASSTWAFARERAVLVLREHLRCGSIPGIFGLCADTQ